MTKFSIITVTLNNLEGLKRTHASIQKLAEKNFEWIVIDGGSNDGTIDFLESSCENFISEKDSGIYDAMNKGIEKSSGDYLIFMNAGDVFFDEKTLSKIPQDFDFIYGDALEDHHYKKARKFLDYKKHMITHHQAMIYSRELIGDFRYNLNYKIAADFDFTARVLNRAKNIKYITQPLCVFESGGVSQTQNKLGRYEQFRIRTKLKLVSPIENISIFMAQFLALLLRLKYPALYWRMKARGSSDNISSDDTQN